MMSGFYLKILQHKKTEIKYREINEIKIIHVDDC